MGLNMEKTLSQRDYRILIGAAGWQHPEWANDVFYPDDLPEDWYLSFYANEFPITLVADSQWNDMAALEHIIDEIIEQATPGFKCIFELEMTEHLIGENSESSSAQSNIDLRLERLHQVKSFVSGLLISTDSNAFENESFCDELVSLNNRFKVCLELNNSATELELTNIKTFCEQNAMSMCWRGEGEAIVPEGSSIWIARCDSNQDNKALTQQLKTVIGEQLKRETLSREHIIIIDGTPPKIETIRNANIMMDIM